MAAADDLKAYLEGLSMAEFIQYAQSIGIHPPQESSFEGYSDARNIVVPPP